MDAVHVCQVPSQKMPLQVKVIQYRWRCPTCGDYWNIIQSVGYSNAFQLPPTGLNLRHRRWVRQVKKRYERGGIKCR